MSTRYRSYHHLLLITINICLSPLTFGYSNGYFNSISFKDIIKIFDIENQSLSTIQGILTGCLSFTGGLGAFWSSNLISRFSRKECLQILSIFMIIVSILLMIRDVRVLMIARCLQGICIGMISSVSPVFIRQFSPTQLASSLCPWNQIGIVIGLTFSFTLTFLLSLFVDPQNYWRIVFGFPIIPAIIQLINFHSKYPYETPKWLLLNNKKEDAKKLLSVIYKQQHVQQVYNEIEKALNANKPRDSVSISEQDLPKISNEMNNMKNIRNGQELKQLKQIKQSLIAKNNEVKTCPLAIIAAFHLAIAQQMVGMGAIIAYSGQIVGEIFPIVQKVFPIFINLIAVTGAFLSIPTLKILGRKKSLEFGALAIAFLLIILSFCFFKIDFSAFSEANWFIKLMICLSLLSIRFVFSFTGGPIVWIYISETVQPSIVPYSTMINWISVAIVNLMFPILKHKLNGNPAWIFMIFGLYTLVAYFINRVVLIQTQNKNQYQINKQYEQKWNQIKFR